MKHISFDPRFVNAAGNDLIQDKIHTIRQNFLYWEHFEGKEVALFTWEGKPYGKNSKHKVFCVKWIVSVQSIYFDDDFFPRIKDKNMSFPFPSMLAKNDGFKTEANFLDWFKNGNYKPGEMAILHFTDFRY